MATDKLAAMKVFQRVAELGSFTRAAEDLGITAATVSKHIAFLEQSIEVHLINRTTRRMSLTDAGCVFLRRIRMLLSNLEEVELEVRGLEKEPQGTIRLNVPMSLGIAHISDAIDGFLQSYPDIEVDLQLNDRMIDLVEQGVDVAIRVRRALADSTLRARPLLQARNVICASPEYLIKHEDVCVPSDLVGHNCLTYSFHEQPNVWILGGSEVLVSGNYRADSSLAIRQSVLKGVGIGFLPWFLVSEDIEKGSLIPLLLDYPAESYTIFALLPPGRRKSIKVGMLVDYLADYFSKKSCWDAPMGEGKPSRIVGDNT